MLFLINRLNFCSLEGIFLIEEKRVNNQQQI